MFGRAVFGGFCACSAVHRWGLWCCPDVATVWGLVGCCVACAVRVRWVTCPSVRLSLVVALMPSKCRFCVRCPHLCLSFPLPLPFWGVLLPFLAVLGGGAVSLLVRCFSWLVVAFVGLVRLSPLLSRWGYPVPIFGRVSGGRITLSKFTKKNFSPNGV